MFSRFLEVKAPTFDERIRVNPVREDNVIQANTRVFDATRDASGPPTRVSRRPLNEGGFDSKAR